MVLSFVHFAKPWCLEGANAPTLLLPHTSKLLARYPCDGGDVRKAAFVLWNFGPALWDQLRFTGDQWVSFSFLVCLLRLPLAAVLPGRLYDRIATVLTFAARLAALAWHVFVSGLAKELTPHSIWYFGSFHSILDLFFFLTLPNPCFALEALTGLVNLTFLAVLSRECARRYPQLGITPAAVLPRQVLVVAACLWMAHSSDRRRRRQRRRQGVTDLGQAAESGPTGLSGLRATQGGQRSQQPRQRRTAAGSTASAAPPSAGVAGGSGSAAAPPKTAAAVGFSAFPDTAEAASTVAQGAVGLSCRDNGQDRNPLGDLSSFLVSGVSGLSSLRSDGSCGSDTAVTSLPPQVARPFSAAVTGGAAGADAIGAAGVESPLPPPLRYRAFIHHRLLYAKIPGYEPSQLTPGFEGRLAALANRGAGVGTTTAGGAVVGTAAQARFGALYVRAGCIELLLEQDLWDGGPMRDDAPDDVTFLGESLGWRGVSLGDVRLEDLLAALQLPPPPPTHGSQAEPAQPTEAELAGAGWNPAAVMQAEAGAEAGANSAGGFGAPAFTEYRLDGTQAAAAAAAFGPLGPCPPEEVAVAPRALALPGLALSAPLGSGSEARHKADAGADRRVARFTLRVGSGAARALPGVADGAHRTAGPAEAVRAPAASTATTAADALRPDGAAPVTAAAGPAAPFPDLEVLVRSRGEYLPVWVTWTRRRVAGAGGGGAAVEAGSRQQATEAVAVAAAVAGAAVEAEAEAAVEAEAVIELLAPPAGSRLLTVDLRRGVRPWRCVPLLLCADPWVASELRAAAEHWAGPADALDCLLRDYGTWEAHVAAFAAAGASGSDDSEAAVAKAEAAAMRPAGRSSPPSIAPPPPAALLAELGCHLLDYAALAGWERTAASIREGLRRLRFGGPAGSETAWQDGGDLQLQLRGGGCQAGEGEVAPGGAQPGEDARTAHTAGGESAAAQGGAAGRDAETLLGLVGGAPTLGDGRDAPFDAGAQIENESVGAGACGGGDSGGSGNSRVGGGIQSPFRSKEASTSSDRLTRDKADADAGACLPAAASAAGGGTAADDGGRAAATWRGALLAVLGLRRSSPAEAAAFKEYAEPWIFAQGHAIRMLETACLFAMLLRCACCGQLFSAAPLTLLSVLGASLASSAARLLLPHAAWARLESRCRLLRYGGYALGKALIAFAGFPGPPGVAAYLRMPGVLALEGIILPGSSLLPPLTALPVLLAVNFITAFELMALQPGTAPRGAALVAARTAAAGIATNLACHVYMRLCFERRRCRRRDGGGGGAAGGGGGAVSVAGAAAGGAGPAAAAGAARGVKGGKEE